MVSQWYPQLCVLSDLPFLGIAAWGDSSELLSNSPCSSAGVFIKKKPQGFFIFPMNPMWLTRKELFCMCQCGHRATSRDQGPHQCLPRGSSGTQTFPGAALCPKPCRQGHLTPAPPWIPDVTPPNSPLSFFCCRAAPGPGLLLVSCGNSWKSSQRLAKCCLAELPAYQVGKKILGDQRAFLLAAASKSSL